MTKARMHSRSSAPYFKKPVFTSSTTGTDDVVNIEALRIARGAVSSALLNARSTQLGEIAEIHHHYSRKAWDGYDAVPITEESRHTAEIVINMLPLEVADPEIIPTTVGGYSLEWQQNRKCLVIEIENKELSCVLIDAEKKRKKTSYSEHYSGEYDDFAKWIRDEFPLHD